MFIAEIFHKELGTLSFTILLLFPILILITKGNPPLVDAVPDAINKNIGSFQVFRFLTYKSVQFELVYQDIKVERTGCISPLNVKGQTCC